MYVQNGTSFACGNHNEMTESDVKQATIQPICQ